MAHHESEQCDQVKSRNQHTIVELEIENKQADDEVNITIETLDAKKDQF